MFATGETAGLLAEWIIDDTSHVFYFLLSRFLPKKLESFSFSFRLVSLCTEMCTQQPWEEGGGGVRWENGRYF